MTSFRQIEANRGNALKSTGPKRAEVELPWQEQDLSPQHQDNLMRYAPGGDGPRHRARNHSLGTARRIASAIRSGPWKPLLKRNRLAAQSEHAIKVTK
jgi:hypothetical protein